MDTKKIKELMKAMEETGTTHLDLEEEGIKLALKRELRTEPHVLGQYYPSFHEEGKLLAASIRTDQALSRGSEMAGEKLAHSMTPKEEVKGTYISSPMVGTYYSCPSPQDPPFIKVGDRVEKNTVVCIIEAMKVMNEIKASTTGIVAEILVESGQPVEFGTKLFRITE